MIVAVTQGRKNYALVRDVKLFADLCEAGGGQLTAYAVDGAGRVQV